MPKQFLTAVFRIRPSRAKAARLERVRRSAEEFFWREMQNARTAAEEIAGLAEKRHRTAALDALLRAIPSRGFKSGMAEPVVQGVHRDLKGALSSFVELRATSATTSFPERGAPPQPTDWEAAVQRLACATTRDDENAARDDMARVERGLPVRPFTLLRARDCRIVRDAAGRLAVLLNVTRANDAGAREAHVREGCDATTREFIRASVRKTLIAVPLECSLWHEHKFLSGRCALKSAKVVQDGDQWFIHATFRFEVTEARCSGKVIGVDRGCVNPVAVAVVDAEGAVLSVPGAFGAEIGRVIASTERRRRDEQRRRGRSGKRHARTVDALLRWMRSGSGMRTIAHGGTAFRNPTIFASNGTRRGSAFTTLK